MLCYNFDARNVDTLTSAQYGDYFGYSLILRNDGRFVATVKKKIFRNQRFKLVKISSVLVGAPKGNSTYKFGVNAPGVLYNCSFLNGNCAEHHVNRLKLSGRYKLLIACNFVYYQM